MDTSPPTREQEADARAHDASTQHDQPTTPKDRNVHDPSMPTDAQDGKPPKTAPRACDDRIKAQKDKNERAARGYLQCAQKARDRQRQKETDGTLAPVRAWRRLTGTESADSARWRREAATDEAACARRATGVWASYSTPKDGDDYGLGPAPDTATKNAHRSERYERFVRALDRDSALDPLVNRAVIERYPWCVDMHLNAEEDDMRRIETARGRLWSLVNFEELPVVTTTKGWTDFNVGVCISDHAWRDYLAGVYY
ncbi:hypothetical protein psal_cds_429 [Pandoravirus salinus]|uniref:Uncharacterized protein n=1 Tax=Pandoravirus salinus TaxID=1349410 RepID=S4VUE8_9VIRU|nr:hypothetical protein psal_cds_429 [Pandoravirus salinus]AGO84164.1 hypothetical protein psal_cds_429 [Pandoravirus salinus]